jgi:hypothetical protein
MLEELVQEMLDNGRICIKVCNTEESIKNVQNILKYFYNRIRSDKLIILNNNTIIEKLNNDDYLIITNPVNRPNIFDNVFYNYVYVFDVIINTNKALYNSNMIFSVFNNRFIINKNRYGKIKDDINMNVLLETRKYKINHIKSIISLAK